MLEERESEAASSFFYSHPRRAASRVAFVEVIRAVRVARGAPAVFLEAETLLASCDLAAVSEPVIRRAAELTSLELRTVDAIHLATAERVAARRIVTYDRRLAAAAPAVGIEVVTPT